MWERKEMIHKSFIRHQIIHSKNQALLFVMCVVLSIISMVALGGFSESITHSLLKDARSLHAADIIIRSRSPISAPVRKAVEQAEQEGLVESERVYEFYAMVRDPVENRTLLSRIKVVGPKYPFYGRVELHSGKEIRETLEKGSVIVEKNLLDRLGLQIGSPLQVGQATFQIKDLVQKEPDRPIRFFSLGPRVFVSSKDLSALGLVDKGSRIRYFILLKVSDSRHLDRITGGLKAIAADHERIETFRSAESRIKRFFDNFLFYIGLTGLFTLLLAGIGIQSSLTSLLRENEETIAIMKTVGAGGRFVITQYGLMVFFLGMAGTTIGITSGFFTQHILIFLLRSFLPYGFEFIFSWKALFQGFTLGVIVVMLFTFMPLLRIKDIKPYAIFRKERAVAPRLLWLALISIGILSLFAVTVIWQLRDASFGLRFVAGAIGFILLNAGLIHLILKAVRKLRVSALAPRQSLKGLFRPGNATKLILITLTASLTVIFSIYFIERNLDESFVRSYPQDSPNVYFIDIQPNQKADFSDVLGNETVYYPIVRARIVSINGNPIDRKKKRMRRRDNLARMFNLTYRNYLLPDESISNGKDLFGYIRQGVPVSILDTVQEMADIDIGDTVTFRIQGIPLEARVSSIRTRIKGSIQPYFYFVFPENILEKAPQTIFTALRVEAESVAGLQNKIVSRFPNVSVIDVTHLISTFAGVMRKLSGIIRLFTFLSIAAGFLILISSVFATRLARIRESVYFKILGAKKRFVLSVFAYENFFIGLVSALLASGFSQAASYLISTYFFHIPYRSYWGVCLLMITGAVMVVCAVGTVASVSILNKKPAIFLREQSEG
jgi:putative ABC transport system permease protein